MFEILYYAPLFCRMNFLQEVDNLKIYHVPVFCAINHFQEVDNFHVSYYEPLFFFFFERFVFNRYVQLEIAQSTYRVLLESQKPRISWQHVCKLKCGIQQKSFPQICRHVTCVWLVGRINISLVTFVLHNFVQRALRIY